MKKKIIITFAIFLTCVALLVYYGQWRTQHRELYFSGTIEATQANLAFQVSGRVVKVHVQEGHAVTEGQVLAELDRSEFQSRINQAKANLDRAIKNKEQLETVLDIYVKTLPAEVARAEASVENARLVMEDAKKNTKRYEQLFEKGVTSEKERDTVRLAYETAKTRLAEGEATLKQARSNLKKIEATKQDIEAARAQVKAAQSLLEQAHIQIDYTFLKAPFSGIVTSRNVEPGEVVTPGREVITVADLSRVDLKIFVDEKEIGRVKPGQRVDVKVDTFPERIFTGYVSYISPEGEFTPKIIQTHKERVKLVYLVKVSIPNPDFVLKTGMPADAWLR